MSFSQSLISIWPQARISTASARIDLPLSRLPSLIQSGNIAPFENLQQFTEAYRAGRIEKKFLPQAHLSLWSGARRARESRIKRHPYIVLDFDDPSQELVQEIYKAEFPGMFCIFRSPGWGVKAFIRVEHEGSLSGRQYERIGVQVCARAALHYNVPVEGLAGNREWVRHSIKLPEDDKYGKLDAGIYTPGRGAGFFLCYDPDMVWRPDVEPYELEIIPENMNRPRRKRTRLSSREWDGPGIDRSVELCGGAIRRGKDIRTLCPICNSRTLDIHSDKLAPNGAPIVKCWQDCQTSKILDELRRLGGY